MAPTRTLSIVVFMEQNAAPINPLWGQEQSLSGRSQGHCMSALFLQLAALRGQEPTSLLGSISLFKQLRLYWTELCQHV